MQRLRETFPVLLRDPEGSSIVYSYVATHSKPDCYSELIAVSIHLKNERVSRILMEYADKWVMASEPMSVNGRTEVVYSVPEVVVKK